MKIEIYKEHEKPDILCYLQYMEDSIDLILENRKGELFIALTLWDDGTYTVNKEDLELAGFRSSTEDE